MEGVNAFQGWENFYVIVGSSAGALIGLQFVVITLIADLPLTQSDAQAGAAFGTPSVVHFCAVLLLSAIVSAPWGDLTTVAELWGGLGVCGLVYSVIVARRLGKQKSYEPVLEDWLFHLLLPFAAYAMLAGSAWMSRSSTKPALFVVGGAALLLLFIGIHNAWDAVLYHVFVKRRERGGEERKP
jgi:hypothetical protein